MTTIQHPSPAIETMSEKLFLQWNDFNENVNFAFQKLRGGKEFTDVILACEDGSIQVSRGAKHAKSLAMEAA